MSHMDAVPTVSLRRAGGATITFGAAGDGSNLQLIHGAQGLGLAPVSFSSTPRLAGHGSILRGKRLNERDIFIPLYMQAGSASELNDVRQQLLAHVSPMDKRELWLRVEVEGGGGYREIPVHYAGGLEGDYGDGYWGNQAKRGLTLKTFDSLWYGEQLQIGQSVDPAVKHFLSTTTAFFPVILSDSTINDTLTFHLAGDAPVKPTWTVTPPGSDLRIENTATGEFFALTGAITETVTIDMQRGRVTSASSPNGELNSLIVPYSTFFELKPGSNTVGFLYTGATSASNVYVTYRPRYLAGY